jgi:hypothetical protein
MGAPKGRKPYEPNFLLATHFQHFCLADHFSLSPTQWNFIFRTARIKIAISHANPLILE